MAASYPKIGAIRRITMIGARGGIVQKLKLALLSTLWAILGLNMAEAFGQIPMDILKSVPTQCLQRHIAVAHLPQLVQSPHYGAMTPNGRRLIGNIWAGPELLARLTGIDPARDISHLVLCDTLVIADGRFNKKEIRNYIKPRTDISEIKDADLLVFAAFHTAPMAIAFLTDTQIAVGPAPYVFFAYRARHKLSKNILADPVMKKLTGSMQGHPMYWFAGRSPGHSHALENGAFPILAGPFHPLIEGVAGFFDYAHGLAGEVTLKTKDAPSAAKLEDFYAQLDAAGKILEDTSVVKWISEGLTVERHGLDIKLFLSYSSDALGRILDYGSAPTNSPELSTQLGDSAQSEDGYRAPISLRMPLPGYTEEARKAGVQGTIRLQVTVGSDGTPRDIRVLQGLGYGMDEAAVHLVRNKFLWIPALLKGKPVGVPATVQFDFRLHPSMVMPH